VSEQSFTQHRGLLYFLGDDGLYVTDGTQVEPVPGAEKVREWFRTRLDENQADAANFAVDVWSWGDFVWVSIPVDGSSTADGDSITVAYHPQTGSFWKTDLPVGAHVKLRIDGTQHLYFAQHGSFGTGNRPYILEYTGSTDDNCDVAHTSDPLFWYLQTSWWSFGLHRQQRRVRRTWALVKKATTYTLGMARDYDSSTEQDTTRVVTATVPTHIEGAWHADAHAVQLYLDGSAGPAQVHGIAVDTEFRRSRYHVA
jgi:hypothetical protein